MTGWAPGGLSGADAAAKIGIVASLRGRGLDGSLACLVFGELDY